MGAASSYGVQRMIKHDSEEVSLEESSVDYDSLSFKDAFGAARSEMGPGGVFTWHGNLYNTYTVAEWNTKNHQEKQQFAEQVESQLSSMEPEESQSDDVRVVADNSSTDNNQYDENLQTASANVSSDDDVRVVGYGDVQLENGRTITVEELEINGQRVAVIDVDKDGVADLAMSDLNHNYQPDEGEVLDLHTGEPLSFANDTDDSPDLLASVDV